MMPRGVHRISSDRDDRMGAKKFTPQKSLGQSLTPKQSHAEFPSLKISRGTKQPRYAGTITNLQIVLNTQKNLYLNQATQKNTCQNFPTQKNPEIVNFNPPTKSFDHPCHLKS